MFTDSSVSFAPHQPFDLTSIALRGSPGTTITGGRGHALLLGWRRGSEVVVHRDRHRCSHALVNEVDDPDDPLTARIPNANGVALSHGLGRLGPCSIDLDMAGLHGGGGGGPSREEAHGPDPRIHSRCRQLGHGLRVRVSCRGVVLSSVDEGMRVHLLVL